MTLAPFRGRCHTCGHDHDAEDTRLRDVLETIGKAAKPAPGAAVNDALRDCVMALVRMIPEACLEGGLEQITDEEHDQVIARAALALWGEDPGKWPVTVRKAAEGLFG